MRKVKKCPHHRRFQGKRMAPRWNSGQVCWHCSRIRAQYLREVKEAARAERIQTIIEADVTKGAYLGPKVAETAPCVEAHLAFLQRGATLRQFEPWDSSTIQLLGGAEGPVHVLPSGSMVPQEGMKGLPARAPFLDTGVPREDAAKVNEVEDVGELKWVDYEVTNWCGIVLKEWGPSFVCPFSHTTGRRLPRSVAYHRNHTDCVVQTPDLRTGKLIGDGADGQHTAL